MSLREAAQQALLVLESGLLVSHSSQVVTDLRAALAEPQVWVCPEAADTHRYDKPGHCEDCGKTLIQMADPEQVALETVYEIIIHWDEGGGKRSRRELARRIVALYAAAPQRDADVPETYFGNMVRDEPVAWMDRDGDLYKMPEIDNWAPPHTLLYAAPFKK